MAKYLIIVFLFAITILNLSLSLLTWTEVRSTLGWVKEIPQNTQFKLRHIVQYTPASMLLSYYCRRFLNLEWQRTFVMVMTYSIVIGTLSEVIQIFVPSRIPSFLDVFWNLVAGVLGFAIVRVIFKKDNHSI